MEIKNIENMIWFGPWNLLEIFKFLHSPKTYLKSKRPNRWFCEWNAQEDVRPLAAAQFMAESLTWAQFGVYNLCQLFARLFGQQQANIVVHTFFWQQNAVWNICCCWAMDGVVIVGAGHHKKIVKKNAQI